MIIAVFRSRVADGAQEDHDKLYTKMSEVITRHSGYSSHKMFHSDDGEAVVIAEFADRATVEAWDADPDHKRAKAQGKEYIFDAYDVAVAEIFERHKKGY